MPRKDPISDFSREEENLTELWDLCRSTLKAAFPEFRKREIEICFYPYIGMKHTIRQKDGTWVVRISDHCRNAPWAVIEAILMILACKVMGKKPDSEFVSTYERFRRNPSAANAVRKRRLLKGRKYMAGDTGKYHSLRDIYERLNRRYFNGQIEVERIGWGIRKSRTRLGHYDPVHNTITLSPLLDSQSIPEFVLSYVVYHEMLHSVFEDASGRSARRIHPPELRRAERAYPDFEEAKRFLKNHFGGGVRREMEAGRHEM
jgi:hypothetical protein